MKLETERLLLHPIAMEDLDALHALWIREPVRRFLWDGEVVAFERTRKIIDESVSLFESGGLGLWGVRRQGENELQGFAGYWHFRTPPVLELLFGVHPAFWNQGLATESSRRLLRYGFEELHFESVEASTDVANSSSIRVLGKLDFGFDRSERVDGLETVFYTLDRTEWKRQSELGKASG